VSRVEPAALEQLAIEVAQEAGALLVGFAGQRREGRDLGVGAKSSATDPVSEADRAAERLIGARLAAARPQDGLLGEEDQDPRPGTSGLRWVVDPLDGTVNFLYGRAAWCVSVACEDEDGALVGVVHHPALGETFHAVRGTGAHLDGGPLAVTEVTDLGRTLVATGFSYDAEVRADQGHDLADLVPRVRDVRRDGSAALDLAWVAAGRTDAYVEFGLAPWDWAAGALLVSEAGGRCSQHRRRLGGRWLTGLVAGGPAAHDGVATWLEGRA
jgi:myo-inositol-1(or 4)-monophosphatase